MRGWVLLSYYPYGHREIEPMEDLHAHGIETRHSSLFDVGVTVGNNLTRYMWGLVYGYFNL